MVEDHMMTEIGQQPLVSIGLPVYNGERFLRESLDSILAQTFSDFELIISDNASTDGTREICQAYLDRDPRIRYHCNDSNLGAVKNFNITFELARGKYFKWMSYDDVCAPEYISKCVEVLENNPSIVLCYPKTIIIDENGNKVANYDDGLDLRSPQPHVRYRQYHNNFRKGKKCNVIFGLMRRETLGQTPLIQPYPDTDKILLGELSLRGEFNELPEYLFLRRDHPRTLVRSHTTYSEQAVWLSTNGDSTVRFFRWKWLGEHLKSVNRVKLNLREKTRCYLQVCRWIYWKRHALLEEVLQAVKSNIWPQPRTPTQL
jgi:glycosyltransferase involved in cell wall biosynthesis